jgi:predicted  nucleic acid-binding Zn-ribbon protein
VKAAAQDQWKLLDLAQTDRRIAQVEHRRQTLPELAALKDLAVQRRTLAEEVVAKSTALSDAKMEQERIEGDLEPARARMERNQKTVDAGTITDHKALRGLTEEIEHLGRRISRLEDAELDVMQAVEDAERAHADADRRRIELDGHIRTVLASRDAGLKGIDDELGELRRMRQTQAGGIPAELLKLYELLRERTGLGCTKLVHGVCEGCGIAANAADLRRYETAADDEVVRCEECNRILVRTGESI